MTTKDFASTIDHTLINPGAVKDDFVKLVSEALDYGFRSVVVPGSRVKLVKELLADRGMAKVLYPVVSQVVGYPLGNQSWKGKVGEVIPEADDIDMVMNIGYFLDGEYGYVKAEIDAIKREFPDKFLKVIISTPHLTDKQIADATKLVSESKADCIKTCTGWEDRGVSLHDLFIINHYRRDDLLLKASGKIADVEFAVELLHAGAHILGSRSGVKLMKQFEEDTKIGGEIR